MRKITHHDTVLLNAKSDIGCDVFGIMKENTDDLEFYIQVNESTHKTAV